MLFYSVVCLVMTSRTVCCYQRYAVLVLSVATIYKFTLCHNLEERYTHFHHLWELSSPSSSSNPVLGLVACYGLQPSFLWSSWQSSSKSKEADWKPINCGVRTLNIKYMHFLLSVVWLPVLQYILVHTKLTSMPMWRTSSRCNVCVHIYFIMKTYL